MMSASKQQDKCTTGVKEDGCFSLSRDAHVARPVFVGELVADFEPIALILAETEDVFLGCLDGDRVLIEALEGSNVFVTESPIVRVRLILDTERRDRELAVASSEAMLVADGEGER